ncbi:MAG TPA: ABC transporter permease [Solirubrobacteraceae bacterium]|jgi:ABC-2 type transport system permease protein|nr:ABC transporter permease [Solirubrobacteraceae bacterium]
MNRAIPGPSALAGDFRRFVHLTRTLAVQEFKLRFFGSVLGYAWQLMRPLLLFGVLYVVFALILKVQSAPHYPVILLMSVILYTFFAEATAGAVSCVLDREPLVRKLHFPRLAIPLSVVLTAGMNLSLNLVVVLVFALASGVYPRLTWFEFPLLVAILAVFASGWAMLLSALFVRFRDLRPIWEVVLQVLFYATPIIYLINKISPQYAWFRQVAMFNPLGSIVTQSRHAMVDPTAPGAAALAGGWAYMAIPGGLVLGVFALGYWYFNRAAPYIAENL